MAKGLPRSHAPGVLERRREAPRNVVRRFGSQSQASRLHRLDADCASVEVGAAPPDADGLPALTCRLDRHGESICAAIGSMNGARFVHDRLELAGWRVESADTQKVKGLPPLACKTDRIDAWLLAELARRDLGAGDLATRPARARRTRASGLAAAPGAPPLELEAARACSAAQPRQALPACRSVRPRGRRLANLGLPEPGRARSTQPCA
jgi:hypothetical protein